MLDTFSSRTARITMDIDISSIGSTGKAGIEVFKGTQYYTRIGYDAGRGYVYFDRVHCGSMMDGVRYAKVDPIDGKKNRPYKVDTNKKRCRFYFVGSFLSLYNINRKERDEMIWGTNILRMNKLNN